ncbi:MAG: class I SAM-dependent rRNA methyltransferase, partial [Chloroflexota bacterium]
MIKTLDHIPGPSQKRLALHVKPAAERALRQDHPWLFDHSIRKQNREGKIGDLAVVFDHKDRFLAIGLYDPISPIRVRILQHRDPADINRSW